MNGLIDFVEIHGFMYLGMWIDRWTWTDMPEYVDG